MTWVNPTTVAPFDTLSASRWNQDVVANTEALFVGYRLNETLYIVSSGTSQFQKSTYPWLRAILVQVRGSGGGGGGVGTSSGTGVGGGGGEGGYAEAFITDIAGLSASVTVTVGAAGAGGVSSGAAGAGNASSFGALVIANGGEPGFSSAGNTITTGGGGGTGDTGDFLIKGTNGFFGSVIPASGSGGGAGGGNSRASNGNGFSGARGGGGAGAVDTGTTARNGGAGGPGFVIVQLFA
jgi:hypothetical protein